MSGPRWRLVTGKGGTGKTTYAAALGLRLATERPTLVVSTDPAHSLGDALSSDLGPEPSAVAGATGLLAAEIDAERAWERWIGVRRAALARVVEGGTLLSADEVRRFLDLPLPGLDELVGLLEVRSLGEETGVAEVVVDTAPTAHTLRLLEMPDALRRFGAMLRAMEEREAAVAAAFGAAAMDDAAVTEIEAEAEAIAARLGDRAQTDAVWVSVAEEVAAAEARRAVARLRALGVAVSALVVNRVLPDDRCSCSLCARRRAAEATVVERLGADLDLPLIVIPEADSEPRGPAALSTLGDPLAGVAWRPLPSAASAPETAADASVCAPPWLERVAPPTARVLLVVGKGGVGKSTVAAALALLLGHTRTAERPLLLSTDPAHSLGDVLDLAIGDVGADVGAGVEARELDAAGPVLAFVRTLADRVEPFLRPGGLDLAVDRAVLERLLEAVPPGIDELGAIGELASRDQSRLLVVDTAPTGHAVRLLASPTVALAWTHALMELLLSYREVVPLAGAGGDLVALAGRLRALEALLSDSARARAIVVARAGELPLAETRRLVGALGDLGTSVSALVVNALPPPGCARAGDASDALATAARAAPPDAVVVAAPEAQPPPRGVDRVVRWGMSWTEVER